MKVIIAGSRGIHDYKHVEIAMASAAMLENIVPTVVLSGAAKGADRLGEHWATAHSLKIERYPADWDRYAKTAGMIRNGQMARRADALVALWDGESSGTRHMIKLMREAGKPVWVHQAPATVVIERPAMRGL